MDLDTVEPINARSMLDAAAAAATTATADRPPVERRRRLSQAALAVTHQKVPRAYSPIVIAGAVRVADFILLSLVGIALYLGYVVPLSRDRLENAPAYDLKDLTKHDGSLGVIREEAYSFYNISRDWQ